MVTKRYTAESHGNSILDFKGCHTDVQNGLASYTPPTAHNSLPAHPYKHLLSLIFLMKPILTEAKMVFQGSFESDELFLQAIIIFNYKFIFSLSRDTVLHPFPHTNTICLSIVTSISIIQHLNYGKFIFMLLTKINDLFIHPIKYIT